MVRPSRSLRRAKSWNALGNGETPREGDDEALSDTSGGVSVRAMVGLAGLSMVASLVVVVRLVRTG